MPKAPAKKAAKDESQAIRRTAELLRHASDATRLSMLLLLEGGELHVGALVDRLNQSQPAVSHHLAILRHANLVVSRRDGKRNFYSATEAARSLVAGARGVMAGI